MSENWRTKYASKQRQSGQYNRQFRYYVNFEMEDWKKWEIPVNVMFDCGSQKGYIKEELKNKLSLQVQQKETLNLNTFETKKFIRKLASV